MIFSFRASSSGTAYATDEPFRHPDLYGWLVNVIFFSFHSIVELCSLNYFIPRMTPSSWSFATWKVANSLWLVISISTIVI